MSYHFLKDILFVYVLWREEIEQYVLRITHFLIRIQQKTPYKEKMIEASQRMIRNEQNNSPSVTKHMKLQIKTLQNAPTDAEKLERLLKIKERQKEEALHIEDTQRLVIERLKCSKLYCI